ncbi:MAG: NADPH-dependent 7-cyano-7-deazaguanine reductase [Chlamydiae bacterium]|nr:NADPH-dependent 7-cyano-7-deazaguanine reductase [Chlamydiota bacterium]
MAIDTLKKAPLGKETFYVSQYTPSLLCPLPRKSKRDEIGIPATLPFFGVDIWNAYEVSWLNLKGKPKVAIAEVNIPCESSYLIESKSFKLYLNSFNQTRFPNGEEVRSTIIRDLNRRTETTVQVRFRYPSDFSTHQLRELSGICIDQLDIETDCYQVDASLLQCSKEIVEEELHSHLLKSNCLVTGQPDWASVYIHYFGPKIDHSSLLKYLVSYREHDEFHEQCIERIYMDITKQCQPQKLTIFGMYTRRGGIDINPFRSNFEACPPKFRTPRQ